MLSRLWSAPALLLVIATLCWSGNFVLGRAVHDHVPPIALSFWRWTIAFVLVIGFAWSHLQRDLPVMWRKRWLVTLLAFLGVATFNALVYYGLNTTTVVNAVLMQSTMPLLIILGSWLVFREPVRSLQMAAVVISLLGVAVIITGGSINALLELSLTPGDGWIMLAVLLYAFYSVLLRKRPLVHPLSFIAATFAIGATMLLPVYLWEHFRVRSLHLDVETLASLAYVGVFPSLVAYLCFNRAVELIGANRAGQFLQLVPVFGSALAALVLGETLLLSHFVGAGLIAAGIGLAHGAKK